MEDIKADRIQTVAVTGATGFIGQYLVRLLLQRGYRVRAWRREKSDLGRLQSADVDWVVGELGKADAAEVLLHRCDALVHAALWRTGPGFRGTEGDLIEFAERNLLGSLQLFEAARRAELSQTVFVSTCAVHELILDDRPLDETHPTWARTHYGAHKAAIEQFVHSYGYSGKMPICAIRPTGVYGETHPIADSKWFQLVQSVVHGENVHCKGGGKEIHAADVAQAIALLLEIDPVTTSGNAYSAFDQYVSRWTVAHLAKELSGSNATIEGSDASPKHLIETKKIRELGMEFGGLSLLRQTIQNMVEACQRN